MAAVKPVLEARISSTWKETKQTDGQTDRQTDRQKVLISTRGTEIYDPN